MDGYKYNVCRSYVTGSLKRLDYGLNSIATTTKYILLWKATLWSRAAGNGLECQCAVGGVLGNKESQWQGKHW